MLELASGSSVRSHRLVAPDRIPARAAHGWKQLIAEVGPTWRATWDVATGVPSRLYGAGISAPGSVASAQLGESFARAFLARHIDLLAPGAAPSDFIVAGNHLANGLRSVGFYQHHRGVRVVGGQLSFRFKNDRLFMVASEAMPSIGLSSIKPAANPDAARARALAWIGQDSADVTDRGLTGPFVLPLVGNLRVDEYRLVYKVSVGANKPVGRWDVYLDARTAEPIARTQTLMFATATINYNAPLRHPAGTRLDFPAAHASHLVAGVSTDSDAAGAITWTGSDDVAVTARPRGPYVRLYNDAGASADNSQTLAADAVFTWDARDQEFTDAQLISFIHGNIVKDYCRTFAPELAHLDQQLQVTVNIDDTCNAYSDGDTINFFRANEECENTGRLSDVLYHEYGHSMHVQSIIPGVGAMDGHLSEGIGDFLAATINNDSGMGRGFFHDDSALREIDPDDYEYSWPDDVGEVHDTGRIFSGAMWDLRKALIEDYGYEAGVALTDRLFYAAVQRAPDIPSSYAEIIAEDDDDGDLSNGTPNECAINAAFALHGLRSITTTIDPLAVELPTQDGFYISVGVGSSSSCAGDEISSAAVDWRLRHAPGTGGSVALSAGDGAFAGYLPSQELGLVVQYKVIISFADSSVRSFPANPADPWYEFFVGEIETIYCTDFESDPFADGWSHGLSAGSEGEGADDWQWGTPAGAGDSGDPSAAHSGTGVIGNDLGEGEYNGTYQSDKVNYALSPTIDIGNYTEVRLQYWRWLNVEDGIYDKGSVYANDSLVWRNFDSEEGATHHRDGEWRFHDIDLKAHLGSGNVQIKFEIDSDGGLEFGGWTIDDFCIVGFAASVCGDGDITGLEVCDDGTANSDSEADACRSDCQPAFCGDDVTDDGEECDDGNEIDDDDCSNSCVGLDDGASGDCGCTVGDRDQRSPTPALLLLLGAALWWRRRRR